MRRLESAIKRLGLLVGVLWADIGFAVMLQERVKTAAVGEFMVMAGLFVAAQPVAIFVLAVVIEQWRDGGWE